MLNIDLRSRTPIYEQVKNQIMELIRVGFYKPDDQLPSIRAVALEENINVNTIKRAFLELESDGVIYTLVGRGSFVSEHALEGERMKEKALAEIEELLRISRSKGISREEIIKITDALYREGDSND